MKQLIALSAVLLAGFFLSGCMKNPGSCNDPNHCTAHCIASTPCGKVIKSRCKHICDQCTFNEPSCQQCWDCTQASAKR